jgi:two-component system, sporulation sensor kinase A
MATSSEYDTPLFAHSPIGMGIIDLDMRWTHVNASLCAMLGYEAHHLTRRELLATSFSHPDDTAKVHEGIRSLLSRELPSFSMRKRCIHSRGHTIWSSLTISLYLNCSGQPAYFLAQLQDITDAVNAQAALQRQQDLHKLITDHAQDLIFCVNLSGRFTFCSRSASALLNDPLSTYVQNIIHHEDRAEARLVVERILQSGCGEMTHLRAILSNGDTRWLECNAQPIVEDDKITGLACVARDITHHKQLNQRAALIERQHAIASLASSVAHGLNNPLAYSLSSIQLALDRFPQHLDADLHDTLRDAHDGTMRALQLIQDLQILTGSASPSFASFNAEQLIRTAAPLAAKLHDLPCPIHIGELPPTLHLWTSEADLHQLLLNLLAHCARALRATHAPTLTIHAAATSSGDAVITVQDNGPAVPEGTLHQLFDPFVSTRIPNDGLGLAICNRLVHNLAGSISCTSTEELTTFRIYLPTRPPE